MAEIGILVMVDKDRRADLDEVAKSLEQRGLRVEQKLSRFRTITGVGESSLIDQLRTVDGVESVRPQQGVQLPPMDDDIPQ
ncbi:MAG TPA: hypothetical protein VGC77_20380 [Rhodopseudomonas sp.]|uniref:hypothetical protein n=1 Tax=Rhodopseudomonas sp. TaxID=1078 RepID=UPI002ED8BB4F